MYIWTIPTTKQKITFFRYEQQKGKKWNDDDDDRDFVRASRLYGRLINY